MKQLEEVIKDVINFFENEGKSIIGSKKEEAIEMIKDVMCICAVEPIKVEAITVSEASLDLWILYRLSFKQICNEMDRNTKEELETLVNKLFCELWDKNLAEIVRFYLENNAEKCREQIALTGMLSVNVDAEHSSNVLNTTSAAMASIVHGCFGDESAMDIIMKELRVYLNRRNGPQYCKVFLL